MTQLLESLIAQWRNCEAGKCGAPKEPPCKCRRAGRRCQRCDRGTEYARRREAGVS